MKTQREWKLDPASISKSEGVSTVMSSVDSCTFSHLHVNMEVIVTELELADSLITIKVVVTLHTLTADGETDVETETVNLTTETLECQKYINILWIKGRA